MPSASPARHWVELLDLPGIVGVGEANWVEVIRGHPRVEALTAGAHVRGLTVEGHGAGAREPILNPFAAFGISADHEGIDAEDTLNRLRLGYYAMVRHGATRQDLPAIAKLWQDGRITDFSRLALVSDTVEPDELLAGRSLNRAVELAVESGLPWPAPSGSPAATLPSASGWGAGSAAWRRGCSPT